MNQENNNNNNNNNNKPDFINYHQNERKEVQDNVDKSREEDSESEEIDLTTPSNTISSNNSSAPVVFVNGCIDFSSKGGHN